jgi:nicotinate-nucleotide pyrophosphorylase (carboxylating)
MSSLDSGYEHPDVRDAVKRALAEDVGSGDITSRLCVEEQRQARGRFIARQEMVVAGMGLLPLVYKQVGGVEELRLIATDGQQVTDGTVLAEVAGKARTLLTTERVALNFLQRLSGIATLARQFVEAAAATGSRTRILDTRKTTPGLRRLEKLAAAAGGAVNHRLGLFDAILIKNNHISAAGGVTAAIDRARPAGLPIEVEVRTRAELEEALAAGVSRVLLDNLPPEDAAEWVAYINGRVEVELSGGITLDTVADYARAGAHYISSGAITHSAKAVDINFRLELL